jgi:uncharacterized protein (DUF1810 family)
MGAVQAMRESSDKFDLERFVHAQERTYEVALAEIHSGRKRTHWMWYVFPQIAGLGVSEMSQRYAISSAAEARAYLAHPVLGPRLIDCAGTVLKVEKRSAHEIFGSPDDQKLRSCATLFAHVSAPGSVFELLLEKYFDAERDARTLERLGVASSAVRGAGAGAVERSAEGGLGGVVSSRDRVDRKS